ncbi:SGNH/GDSL hydrolase family protein [Streptomyces celluloflavus]|uniref:SGNH/GDSL hydrolase family protein n=1 Tax=Streptomyces celluloflavus TaxID=58344 RepID=UPI0036DD3F31
MRPQGGLLRRSAARVLLPVLALVLTVLPLPGATAAPRPAVPGRTAVPSGAVPAAARPPHHWVGGWATALTPPGSSGLSATGFADRTVRMVVHLAAGGDRLRLRLSNAYGTRPLDLGAVTVARRSAGAATVPGTRRAVTFGGQRSAAVPVGAEAVSDPVPLRVAADRDLVVSVHLPTPTGPTTWHGWAKQTNYLSTPGDHTGDEDGTAFPEEATSWFFLHGVDVSSTVAAHTVVAFGDSITEGGAIPDEVNLRWPDILARWLAGGARPGRGLSVVNAGIGGNRLLSDAGTAVEGRINLGVNAEARFARDVLDRPAVSAAIVLLGTNDLGSDSGVHPGSGLTSGELIAGLASLANRAHAAGIALHAGTITPNTKLTPAAERIRVTVNRWIRTGHAFDSVIDFDAALRDPAAPQRLLPGYDSGDGVHPNIAGMRTMAQTVDLSTLSRPPVAG